MSPDIEVGPATDAARYLETDNVVWFATQRSETLEQQLLGVPVGQRFAAELEGGPTTTYAGVYGVRPLRLAVPGPRSVAAAGLTWVGVHPDCRRRGVLTAMLRDHLERTRADGLSLSVLMASEPTIYGRHGYGEATRAFRATLGAGTTLSAPHLDEAAGRVTTSFHTGSDPGMAERLRAVDEHLMTVRTGSIVFEPDFYDRILLECSEELAKNEPMRLLFATEDGKDVGAAAFRREHKWTDGTPAGTLEVMWADGTPAVRLALLRRLLSFDLIGKVRLSPFGVDDPLWSWVGPRAANPLQIGDNLWVRLVDLPAAIAARTYEGACDVVVEVSDDQLPDNAGRWRITVANGSGSAERTDSQADVALPVSVLGSAYLGGANLTAALAAGALAEQRPGAIGELSRAFRTELAPAPSPGF